MNNTENLDTAGVIDLLSIQKELSLYIHVPFCTSKCDYCNFYSIPSGNSDKTLKNKYSDMLLREISSTAEAYGKPFKTVFIGGGNPGILDEKVLSQIFSLVSTAGKPAEITIECNPETITDSLISSLDTGHCTRLSMGIQSYSNAALEKLGRRGLDSEALKQVSRRLGGNRGNWELNIDLITGIPGFSVKNTLDDIDTAINLSHPEHISVYELTIEENTPLAARLDKDYPTELHDNGAGLKSTWAHLAGAGYRQYEISNFCLDQDDSPHKHECLHNRQYWEMRPYLGLGPGAASTIFNHASGSVIRIEAQHDIHAYISGGNLKGEYIENSLESLHYLDENLYSVDILDTGMYMLEYFIMGLRLSEGISLKTFRNIFHCDIPDIIERTISQGTQAGTLRIQGGRLLCTSDGFLILNHILRDIMIEIDTRLGSISNPIDLTAVFEL